MTRPQRPTLAELRKEARRVFGPGAPELAAEALRLRAAIRDLRNRAYKSIGTVLTGGEYTDFYAGKEHVYAWVMDECDAILNDPETKT